MDEETYKKLFPESYKRSLRMKSIKEKFLKKLEEVREKEKGRIESGEPRKPMSVEQIQNIKKIKELNIQIKAIENSFMQKRIEVNKENLVKLRRKEILIDGVINEARYKISRIPKFKEKVLVKVYRKVDYFEGERAKINQKIEAIKEEMKGFSLAIKTNL